MAAENFKKLEIWQESHRLMLKVYEVSKDFPKSEAFGLTDQLRRAALSVPSNIAESSGRYHYADTAKFIFNARGSVYEVMSQLRAAHDLGYLNKQDFDSLDSDYETLVKRINSYARYLTDKKSQSTN